MTTATARLALGLDIGGTSTRALVVDGDGVRRGFGRADGANLTSHALDSALDAVSAALDAALADVEPASVRAAVVGTAGDRNLTVPEVVTAFGERWRRAGLTCDYDVQTDALIAFVAGAAEPTGTLLLSGTGALAARVTDRRIAHMVDGNGWLLGDLGSGFWLGREAVRVTLADIDHQRPSGPLAQAVIQTLLGAVQPAAPVQQRAAHAPPNPVEQYPAPVASREVALDLVLAVHGKPPVALAALAPLVTAHAGVDPVADRILGEAADHLLAAADTVRADGDGSPVVLAGSLLTADTPLAHLVRPELAKRWPDAPVTAAIDAVAGAAWLAAVAMNSLSHSAAARLHGRMFG